MANFMGPMAPPQAAPQTPPQLDIRTNPGQRAQFKTFMQGMSRPAAPPTTAPIAPMLPAPTPMDQIDIFAPVPMANGGLADPYAMEGKIGQSVGPKMVGGTTNVIDASGNDPRPTDEEVGVLAKQLQLGQDLYDVNQSYNDPGRPMFGMADLFAPGGALSFAAPSFSPSSAPNMMQNAMQGILSATQMDGPMGGTFGISPVTRDGNLGIMANFTVPFEDGGPVRMFMGGDPQAYGEERGRQDTSETARERQRVGGTTNVFEGDSSPREERDETERRVNEAVAATQQVEAAQQLRDDINDSLRAEIAAQNPVDLTFGAPRTDTSGRIIGELTDTDEFFANQNMAADQRLDDAVKSIIAVDKTEQFDDLLGDVFVDPLVSPQSPIDDFLARNPQPRETDPINPFGQLMAGDVVYNRGKDNERTVSRFADLENRMGIKDARVNKGQGLSALAEPILSKVASAFGGAKATDIFDNVVNQNKQPIIAADTNQIVGYADDGPFGRVYTGRAGYNPFGADGSSYTVDPQTGALIVNRKQENQGEDDQQRNRVSSTPLPTTDTTDTTPPPVTPPVVTPPVMPDPMNVVVPSTRVADPLGLTPPAFAPVQSVGLPQSFLDLLASFNRPAPVAMQEGGAVLDQAAGNFLEALKVA